MEELWGIGFSTDGGEAISEQKPRVKKPSVTKDESRLTKWMIPKIYFSLMDSFRGNSHLTSVF